MKWNEKKCFAIQAAQGAVLVSGSAWWVRFFPCTIAAMAWIEMGALRIHEMD